MQVYTNVFHGYITNFVVSDPSGNPPDISHECVIAFENTPYLEIVIPYLNELEPFQMKRDLEVLLERSHEIFDEEYPFRCIPATEEQSSLYKATESTNHMYVYWHIPNSRARVRLFLKVNDYERAIYYGGIYHNEYLDQIKDNIQELLSTMKY